MRLLKVFLTLGCVFILTISAHSQTTNADTTLYRVETRDGNTYTGTIISEDSLRVQLSTKKLGVIAIQRKHIKSLKLVNRREIRDDEIWFANPQATRYFWSPNGFGLRKGEGYYHNIWVLWNQFAYGITDHFSLGGGVIPLFLFGGTPTPLFITPKFSVPVKADKLSFGAGALVGTVLGEPGSTFGILYGVGTLGTPDKNLTFGAGYGFTGDEWASSPMINLNGMLRISEKWYLLTENYFTGTDGEGFGILMMGGRWMIKKAALDFGLVMPLNTDSGFIGIPWLGFTVPFGRK